MYRGRGGSNGTRCQLALFHGLLEALSKHLQVRIPHQAKGKVEATPLDTGEMLTPLSPFFFFDPFEG